MAATFTAGGGNTTVKFEWTKPTATMSAVIGSAAHYLVKDDTIFAGMTNQQKLDIVDANVKQHIINMAKTYDIQAATKTAAVNTLTSNGSGSIAIDLSISNNFSHTMTENTTLAAPSNAVAGTSGQIVFTQHASAAKTLAFNTAWVSTDGTTPTISTTVGTVNVLTYYIVDNTHIWFALNKHGVA